MLNKRQYAYPWESIGNVISTKGQPTTCRCVDSGFFTVWKKISNCCVQKRFNTLDMPIMSACQLVLCKYARNSLVDFEHVLTGK